MVQTVYITHNSFITILEHVQYTRSINEYTYIHILYVFAYTLFLLKCINN